MRYFTVEADRETGLWYWHTLSETEDRWSSDQADTDEFHYDQFVDKSIEPSGANMAVRVEWV